jgi:hypothetical protein
MHDRELTSLFGNTGAADGIAGSGNAALRIFRLLHEEQGVEDDGFSEGDGQNRLDHDLRGRAGIPSHRDRRSLANQPYADGRAQGCQADM